MRLIHQGENTWYKNPMVFGEGWVAFYSTTTTERIETGGICKIRRFYRREIKNFII